MKYKKRLKIIVESLKMYEKSILNLNFIINIYFNITIKNSFTHDLKRPKKRNFYKKSDKYFGQYNIITKFKL